MPIVGRGHLEPDPQSIPGPNGQEQPLLATPADYRELSAAQVQCLAASNASLSDLIMRERELNEPHCPIVSVVRIHRKQQERTRNCILEYSAQEIQNQASALALQAFFQLAESEAQADVALAASQSLGNVALQVRQWKERGLKLPTDIDSVEKQWLDAQTKYAQLRISIRESNAQLSELLSLPYDAETPFWPQADLTIRTDPIDPDQAVQTGLTYRGDLNVLRCALSNLNENTLPETRELIKTVNGLLGDRKSKEFTRQVLAPLMQILGLSSRETQMRREQLARLLSNREQSVAEDIRLAVHKLGLQLYVVDLARKELLQAQTRLEQIQEKEQKGLASVLDRIQVEGDWYKARSNFIHEVMQWHIDMIKLKQAQGVLPVECTGSQFCH
jgi:outer membrane protein TolC